MTFKLTQRIPARTVTHEAEWCKRDFMKMSPQFRAIRAKSRRPMTSCGLCRHPFVDGEMMGLACFKKGGNKTLCQSCCDKLMSERKDGEA